MSKPIEIIIIGGGGQPPGGGRAAYDPLNVTAAEEEGIKIRIKKPDDMSVADALRAALAEVDGTQTE